jgi:hypothetical protein
LHLGIFEQSAWPDFEKPSRLGDIAVGNIHKITLVRKVFTQVVGHDDGAVMAAGAAEGDVETGLSLFLVERDEKSHQIK